MKTTLELNGELWKIVKHLAVDQDTTASALVEEALKEIVERRRKVPVRIGRS